MDRITERAKIGLWGRIKRLALTDVGAIVRGFKAADIDAMERMLLEADLGIAATTDLVGMLEDGVRRGTFKSEDDLRRALSGRLAQILAAPGDPARIARAESDPTVILVIGVNGVGKTTSIAKLARRLQREGERVLLVAADTYRAGAIAQLETWAERLGVPCVTGAPGGDPASVAFDGIVAAQARGATMVIVDTAGRLHTQEGLMEELRKVVRVIARKAPGAPHETLLVLDGTVGQNAVQQGKLFSQAVSPTGLIVTKLDGTARGGAVVALRHELALPIRFLGTGEQPEDLEVFDAAKFAEDLVGDEDPTDSR
ncbi:MAG TPA: signal recognition particle-docking protein FtsY [Gemmatimonadales bacterium]|nr:signal recognition particle-docking protein FtsY [Gemmatimonadales bacterium]